MDLNAGIGWLGLAANVGVFRRPHWAAREAVMLLETHRCAGRLTPEGLESLKRYKKLYEAAELVFIGHFPRLGTRPHASFRDGTVRRSEHDGSGGHTSGSG